MSRLRLARKELGLTQEELGKRAGVARTTVQHAECPYHFSRSDHAAALYSAVGLSLEDLSADLGDKRVPSKRTAMTTR
jgi:transcriptional regulator with XRE-family HTH domain